MGDVDTREHSDIKAINSIQDISYKRSIC